VAESATVLETSYDMLLITHHNLHTTVFYTLSKQMTSYTLDNVLQFLQLEQNNLLENPKILSRERNMAPYIKDKPS
jgi:hypothetical protein